MVGDSKMHCFVRHEVSCAVRAAQTCLAAVKSRQTKNSLNSLLIHHLPTSLSELAGQQ
jgi:hypothetical protein